MGAFKSLFRNLGFLTISRIIEMLIPIIIIPILTRRIGIDMYGLTVFAQSILVYGMVLVEFGFNTTSVKDISENESNTKVHNEIIGLVLFSRIGLYLILVIFLFLLGLVVPFIRENPLLLFLSSWPCINQIFFPSWFFQGIEKMEVIAVITLVTKGLFLVFVLIYVKEPSDYLLVPFFNMIAVLLAAVVCGVYIYTKLGIRVKIPSLRNIIAYSREAWPLFLANISKLYIKANKILLGAFVGYETVAFYDLAEKVVNLARVPITLISQAIFPQALKTKSITFISKIFIRTFILNICGIVIIFFLGDYVIFFLSDQSSIESTRLLRVLILVLIPVTLNVFYGRQLLFVFGYKSEFSKTIISAGIFYLIAVSIHIATSQVTLFTVAFIVIGSELVTSIGSIYYSSKRGLKLKFI